MSAMGRKRTLASQVNERPLTGAGQKLGNDCNGLKSDAYTLAKNKGPVGDVPEGKAIRTHLGHSITAAPSFSPYLRR